jgi:hypothetical protein
MATAPSVYAIEPHTTNVPAEKKLIKSDKPLIQYGTDPPAAKNDFMLVPDLANDIPVTKTTREKIDMVQ